MRPSRVHTSKRILPLHRYLSVAMLMPVISIFLAGCASTVPPIPPSATFPDALKALAAGHQICGVTVAVIKNRQLDSIASAAGCPAASAPDADTVFQAASLSKPVFAYAVLKLVAQGTLELDAPVVKYLPQGYRHQFNPGKAEPSSMVTDPRLQAITVRMVLNHTSGLPNWASGPLTFDSAPGTKWGYSGEGYVLLQRAVEAVTKQSLDQFMTSAVFKPMAMHHSSYVWSNRFAQTLLPGTKANGAPRAAMNPEEANAAFSLYTTAADYAKFLAKLLNDEEVLKQLSTAPVSVDPGLGLSWGLGWGMERVQEDDYIWHWGNNPGYRAFVMASVRTGDGFLMLTNSENGLALAEPVTQKLLPREHKVFQISVLGGDVMTVLCKRLRVCL